MAETTVVAAFQTNVKASSLNNNNSRRQGQHTTHEIDDWRRETNVCDVHNLSTAAQHKFSNTHATKRLKYKKNEHLTENMRLLGQDTEL